MGWNPTNLGLVVWFAASAAFVARFPDLGTVTGRRATWLGAHPVWSGMEKNSA